ncbi:hypothetical protein HNY73_007652 [Argiope bruennichi]|uniref:J domain-containing protein n=1 Tax=Argiope bruennichi TaxID=94029 RepID=A0A8T0FLQ6_ARGBR|nr:hypothetical protein HNY73_007652 [Argiope bruennichi]
MCNMDLISAKAALGRLLGCNVEFLPFSDLKVLIRKSKLAWHPDKNVDKDNLNEFAELFSELIDAWSVYCKYNAPSNSTQGSFSDDPKFDFQNFTQARPDLFCDESISSSDEDFIPPSQKSKKSSSESDTDSRYAREATPEYNDTPFENDFFIPSPKKTPLDFSPV